MLDIQTQAPDFSLMSSTGSAISLKDYRNSKNVILAFYPADWSSVCGDQMALYNQMLYLFEKKDAQLLGISVDSVFCHKAFAEARNLHFPLLADFEPKGAVSRLYQAYHEDRGYSKRALYVINKQGIITWNYLSPDSENPGADGILDALDQLS